MTGALPLGQFGRRILWRSEFLVVVSVVLFAAGAGVAGAYIGFDDVLDRAGRLSAIVVVILLILSTLGLVAIRLSLNSRSRRSLTISM